jgi:FkbM family methyltransferase
MNKLKIAIIDVIGLNYDGTTLTKKGIGGSESSIISVAKELVKVGFEVTIFNDCDTAETKPGIYDGVNYLPIIALGNKDYGFDIVISQRTVIPFTPIEIYDQVMQPPPRNFDPKLFLQLQKPSQFKIVWMQDTFIWGDHLLENLVTEGKIDEIFNLSDWHISYTTHSDHGFRRNFEVLKDKIFHTRNAINRWIDWVDVKKKDPNLFVYNASVTKGMVPLIEKIWPKLKTKLPNARLKIIGGYYQFRDESEMSPAQKDVIRLQRLTANDPSVEFTGIIPQPKIAEIMANASYNLYPGAFPETSGISTIESINYNTPILGVKFGAMEESGTEMAGYYMDYAIEPNGLFPWINTDQQVDQYVDMVLRAVNNTYLHQQKQYACNNAKDISTWDTVALQWKQHFYNIFGLEQDPEEKSQTDWINYRVHKVFGKRMTNPDETIVTKKPILVEPVPNQPLTKLAIVDIVGMAYDGGTLSRKGLGGSESAVILIAKELTKIGFSVTVFNGCDEDRNSPGVYDGVIYKPLSEIGEGPDNFDVVISSRVVTPFINEWWYNYPQSTNRKVDYEKFAKMRNNAKLKVFWMHDTFCWGDDVLEDLVHHGMIDEIWTLSDFHAYYVMNAAHPRLRNFEVLRDHMWVTRNGIVKYFDEIDLDAKDPNLFIFNANMSKGLGCLLNGVWPKVKEKLPDARLTVIGGHYKLGAAFAHGDEETEFMKIAGPHMEDPTITFTGIISQREVAEYCKKSTYFIYPAVLPETYGISTMEALYANTLLITCKFGALEESAGPNSYYIDYAMEPNGVCPHINAANQIDKFVNMVVDVYNSPEETRRRMLALDEIKDLLGWEVTALEWKHHIHSKLNLPISKTEHQMVRYTKTKYHEMFERKWSCEEEWLAPKQSKEQKIIVLSPLFNAGDYAIKCIDSVAAQDYENYEHWLCDDASTDDTVDKITKHIKSLPKAIRGKFKLIKNKKNCGAVFNHMKMIRETNLDDIIMMLDGDDWLANRSDIFDYYNKIHRDYDFTYGSCWSVVDNIPLISQPYPPEIKAEKLYKNYRFNWNMPYTHLRTFKSKYLLSETDDKFQDENGEWFKAGGDNSTFYTALNNVDPDKVYVISDIVYNYNDASPLNDYKVNKDTQDRAINSILGSSEPIVIEQPKIETAEIARLNKRVLIAIPTNKNIEAVTFKSIYDLIVPDGYTVDFQYFWGYQVDQVRNLIAHWAINNHYDYLFAVDSDISFPPDTLVRLLSHDKDLVCGVYIQRIPGTHTIEVMRRNQQGGVTHVDWAEIKGRGLVSIDGCGFGCVLIKSQMLKAMEYPHFLYKSAIDHAHTISEDVYFCMKATDLGFKLWCDTDVICDHTGSSTYTVDRSMPTKPGLSNQELHLRNLRYSETIPDSHRSYLIKMRDEMNVNPKVIYDIGSSVLHWTDAAFGVWNKSGFIAFDAMESLEFLYREAHMDYHISVLSDQPNKVVNFFENTNFPAGNSYYRENPKYSPNANMIFDDAHSVRKVTTTLDSVVKSRGYPLPDLIKIDVQGAELDVLKGASETLKTCKDLILELQEVEYNQGAPNKEEVIKYVESLGFKLVTPFFASVSGFDGDYHFTRI